MAEEEPELTYSDHCGSYLVDGERVEVLIYKLESDAGWVLEVVNGNGTSTVWDQPFISDGMAWREFAKTVEDEGIRAFWDEEDPRGRLQ
ncbi:hypothetical protein RXV90_08795 [Rhodophyticola sp. MJ-SS7]|nr:hypothetical protein [Rhodophyticola sp. MJ-SS7]